MPLSPEKIRARREKLALTLQEASARAGITFQSWHRVESGQRDDPQLSTAEKIASALNCALSAISRP
jgi:transcriptional regulator with XRE-family HTH domain